MDLWLIQPRQILYEGKWEGLVPGNRDFFGTLWNGIEPLGECQLGPKVSIYWTVASAVNLNHKTYKKSTGNCNVLYIKERSGTKKYNWLSSKEDFFRKNGCGEYSLVANVRSISGAQWPGNYGLQGMYSMYLCINLWIELLQMPVLIYCTVFQYICVFYIKLKLLFRNFIMLIFLLSLLNLCNCTTIKIRRKKCSEIVFLFSFYLRYSTLLHLPPLRLHCVRGCWDRTQQDCCDFDIDSQTL